MCTRPCVLADHSFKARAVKLIQQIAANLNFKLKGLVFLIHTVDDLRQCCSTRVRTRTRVRTEGMTWT